MQIFELDGYLRLRTDWMHQFGLGQGYTSIPSGNVGNYGLPPFPLPLECWSPSDPGALQPSDNNRAAPNNPQGPCASKNIGGANTRLRLQPTINVTDQVRVLGLVDVLDNTILGSTPETLAGIEGYNRPARNGRAQRRARRRRLRLPEHQPVPARSRRERLRGQHPRQARVGRDRQRVRVDPVRPHALALGTRHGLQRGRLPRLRRRDDRRPRDGSDDDLRTPDRGGVGHRRAGTDDPAADAGSKRPERHPVRPVAGRRRDAVHGVDHAHRHPGEGARARRPRRHRRQLRRPGRVPQPGQHRAAQDRRRRGAVDHRPAAADAGPAVRTRRRTAPSASRPTCGSSCSTRR